MSGQTVEFSPALVAMAIDRVLGHSEHLAKRLLQDAFTEQSARQWNRRADMFEAAMPRAGDFVGQATDADLAQQEQRLASIVTACRRHAIVLSMGERS